MLNLNFVRRHRATAAAACCLALVACGTITGGSVLSAITSTSVGTSLINALVNSLAPGVNKAIADGSAAASADLKMMAYALPWVQQALDYFGPAVGVTAARIAQLDSDIAHAEAMLANPPTDVASAVANGARVYQDVLALLQPAVSAAPVVAAQRR